MKRHSEFPAQVRRLVEVALDGVQPPDDDPAELAESAAALEIDVATLIEWRKDYQWWTTADEWRNGIIDSTVGQIVEASTEPGARNWRRWSITGKAALWLYALGVSAGGGTQWNWAGRRALGISISGTRNSYTARRHKPVYVLGWRVDNWRCLLKYRHWPSPHRVAFGLCAKCAPCPDCNRPVPLEHDCVAAS